MKVNTIKKMPQQEGLFNTVKLTIQLALVSTNLVTITLLRLFLQKNIGLNNMKGIKCISTAYIVLFTLVLT